MTFELKREREKPATEEKISQDLLSEQQKHH